jgi:hypothetical protein
LHLGLTPHSVLDDTEKDEGHGDYQEQMGVHGVGTEHGFQRMGEGTGGQVVPKVRGAREHEERDRAGQQAGEGSSSHAHLQ